MADPQRAGLKHFCKGADRSLAELTEREIDDLVSFLVSLTSAQYRERGAKELARQREISLTNRPQRDTARAFGSKPPRPEPPGN